MQGTLKDQSKLPSDAGGDVAGEAARAKARSDVTTAKSEGPRAHAAQNVIGKLTPAAEAVTASIEARVSKVQDRFPSDRIPPAPPQQPADLHSEASHKSFLARHPRRSIAALVLSIVAAMAGYVYWDYSDHFVSTDDAFIAARQFPIAPKVSGYITAVPVTDNQHVDAGGTIARIDERDYRIALEQANAQVASAEAGIQNVDAQINVQETQIASNQAQVDQVKAGVVFAQQQAVRYQDLAQRGDGSVQNAQQYSSQLNQQQASLQSAEAVLKLAQRQIEALKAQRASAVASLWQAKAQRDQAALNLSYTTVTAAQAGRIAQLGAAVGQFAEAGTNLTMFVPDEIWVVANFKETQLDHMQPGQPVTLTIDAYPERTLQGHVASIQPGSGTAFSLLPAENATGNYVKIVQRVPVKVILDNPPADVTLGPGMSVEPTVRVDPKQSLYERARAWL